MFDATIEIIEPQRVMRYCLTQDMEILTFADVLDLWEADLIFRGYFTDLLADSPFNAYRWETPALTIARSKLPFQFVLLNEPRFSSRKTDSQTFAHHFTNGETDPSVVAFKNIGGDATLVVPSPRTAMSTYGHLAAFLRNAPKEQANELWQVISTTIKSLMGHNPLWLSTAGGGVAWLHVRLDSHPKYYGYAPYRTV